MFASKRRPPTIDNVSIRFDHALFYLTEVLRRTEEVVAQEVALRVGGRHGPKIVHEEVDDGEGDDKKEGR